jgi:hypothetical protein
MLRSNCATRSNNSWIGDVDLPVKTDAAGRQIEPDVQEAEARIRRPTRRFDRARRKGASI